jgi:hypothetical protein
MDIHTPVKKPSHIFLFNSRHSLLRKALADTNTPSIAIDAFLAQHALVHSSKVSNLSPDPTKNTQGAKNAARHNLIHLNEIIKMKRKLIRL